MAGRAALAFIGISRSTIIDVAFDIVDEHGIEALNLRRVAGILGIRPPSIYKYFQNLDEVQDALSARALTALLEVHRDVGLGRQGRDALEAFALAERAYAQAHPALYCVAQREPRGANAELRLLRQAYMDLAANMLTGYSIPAAIVPEVSNCLSTALQGFINAEISGRGRSRAEFDRNYDRLLDILDAGARSAGAPQPSGQARPQAPTL